MGIRLFLRMLRTILFLILALVLLPVMAIYVDTPLDPGIIKAITNLVYLAISVALGCFVISELTGNYSQVDKLWSLLPIGYSWYIALTGDAHPRLILMAVLVTLWGVRLTYNFARKGGYSLKFWGGTEDYRWGELRKLPLLSSPWRFRLFNLFFISLFQNGLILLMTLPIAMAWQGNDTPLGWLDMVAACLMLLFIFMEGVADHQQFTFQKEKQRLIREKVPLTGDYADGFCQDGLWACFRHPNYTAEQAIWLCFYLFSVAATGRWLNASLSGALLLFVLFKGSSDFSEKISARKYPAYRQYQNKVGRFIPRIF